MHYAPLIYMCVLINVFLKQAKAALQAARPSRIVGQGYSQAGTFWGVLNISLGAFGAQLGFNSVN